MLLHVDKGSVTDPAVEKRVNAMLDEVSSLDSVVAITSPYDTQGAAQISQDGQTAYATVQFDAQPTSSRPTRSRP